MVEMRTGNGLERGTQKGIALENIGQVDFVSPVKLGSSPLRRTRVFLSPRQ